MRVHLIQPRQAFGPPERAAELAEVWRKSDGLFSDYTHPDGRPTFSELFTLTRPGTLNVIANADIFFDALGVSLMVDFYSRLPENALYRTALALSRHDVLPDGSTRLHDHSDSQDAWAVYGNVTLDAPFMMGQPGCDNRLAHIMQAAGFNLFNPSKTIKCFHLHLTSYRSYLVDGSGVGRGGDKIERVPPPYSLVKPTEL